MRILLVDPPGKNKGFNTGLGYLSAVLKRTHDVYVLDLNNIEIGACGDPNPEMPFDDLKTKIIREVEKFSPDIFGVSVKTFTSEIAGQFFAFLKEKKPHILTVVGGPHITLDGYNFINQNEIDFGITGEGEISFPKLCNAINRGQHFEDVEGIYYRKNAKLIHNPKNDTIKNLDSLPFPDYDTFSSVIENNGHLNEYPLLTSRGCPYKCSYCSMPKIMGNRWRAHTPQRVIEELQHAKQEYHSTHFTVVDDNFTLKLNRVKSICDLLISEHINLSWNSQNGIRADRITEDLAKVMKQSGCQHVWIGIESADEDVFNRINKGEKLQDVKKGIKHLKQAGIGVGGFFIIGLPYSTREADLKGVDFVKKNKIDGWWFNFVPYPHTQAFDWVQKHGKQLRPSDGVLQFGTSSIDPVFETEEYSKESRIRTYDEIHIKLGLFDRLVDSSLNQRIKWKNIFKIVSNYGVNKIFFLLVFILKYNLKLFIKKLIKYTFLDRRLGWKF